MYGLGEMEKREGEVEKRGGGSLTVFTFDEVFILFYLSSDDDEES